MTNAEPEPTAITRRTLLAGAGVLLLIAARPAHALAPELLSAMRGFTEGAPTREGRVKLDIEPLVENGNAVPVTVSVDSPMTAADHVRAIAIFNQKNPQPGVVQATLTPAMGQARLATRIRLATSQQIVAVARLADGSCWTHAVDVVVTIAACVE
jgi:sulfur-oxidizing protein SoxY